MAACDEKENGDLRHRGNEIFPVDNEAFPRGNEAFAIAKEAFPRRNEAFWAARLIIQLLGNPGGSILCLLDRIVLKSDV